MSSVRYAVLFDFNGVLVDDEPIHFVAAKKALAECGIELTEKEYYGPLFGLSDILLFSEVLNKNKIKSNELLAKLLIRKSEHYVELIERTDILFDGVKDLVVALFERAILGIVSSALSSEIDLILTRYELKKFFSFTISGDDVAEHKPNPAPYKEALKRLKDIQPEIEPARVVAIEDSKAGIRSAKSCKIKAIGVAHYLPPQELKEADLVVRNIGEISLEVIERIVLK